MNRDETTGTEGDLPANRPALFALRPPGPGTGNGV